MNKSEEELDEFVDGNKEDQISSPCKSECIMSVPQCNDTRSHRSRRTRPAQSCRLVWLYSNIDEVDNYDNQTTITKLREIVKTVHTFVVMDECLDVITNINDESVLMVCSVVLSRTVQSIIQDIPQISSIFVFYEHDDQQIQWIEGSSKIKGVFSDIDQLCRELTYVVSRSNKTNVPMSMLSLSSDEVAAENANQLDQSFMNTKLLKDATLTIDSKPQNFEEFITCCRELNGNDRAHASKVEMLKHEYYQKGVIYCYTCYRFLHSTLNQALYEMDVCRIIDLGFFTRDLHEHIIQLHSEQYPEGRQFDSFVVYRGQGMSQTDFAKLKKSKGSLLAFNNFLSTSKDRQVAVFYAESNQQDPNVVGVLFEMTIDPSIRSVPFADISGISRYHEEEEVLFSTHAIFRTGQLKPPDESSRFWRVDLVWTADYDAKLRILTEYIQQETFPYAEGWYRFVILLIRFGEFDAAELKCNALLAQTTDNLEKARAYHQLGAIKDNLGNYTEAMKFYKKAMKFYKKAMKFYKKSITIKEGILSPTDNQLAHSYGGIGLVYNNMGEYKKSLLFHEKALNIYQKNLPADHPDLAISYSNFGRVHREMGEYPKALSFFKKALEIRQNSFPLNHPSLATSYNDIGTVYYSTGECSEATSWYEKALEIFLENYPPMHPCLATSYTNIGSVHIIKGEYPKALPFYEKAFEIYQATLPPNHRSLINARDNIALVYRRMFDDLIASLFHKQAPEIRETTLRSNRLICLLHAAALAKQTTIQKRFYFMKKHFGIAKTLCRQTLVVWVCIYTVILAWCMNSQVTI